MDIRSLQYFLAVAREESITKAAETLHMTQPPLSRAIKDLEDELGNQLFIRGSRKVTLTDDGMLLRGRAEELIDLMEKTKNEMISSDYDISGDVYIGGGESEAISYLADAACELQKKYPNIHYHIYAGDGEQVAERLDKGLIDFGLLVAEPTGFEKYDYIRLPTKDTWGVLMRDDSPLAGKDCITAEDLWDKPLIVSQQASKTGEMFRWLKRSEDELNIVLKYDLIYNASQFVKSGFGYLIGLDRLINTSGDSGLCFKPVYPTWESDLYFVWKKYQVFSRASAAYLGEMQKLAILNSTQN
ncbi:MAG: LysR family transcriptional regulator [Oscillospiraceae bacterium]|nr:LysR family transcriptional regulator [Oscillospiraceae bacterium]